MRDILYETSINQALAQWIAYLKRGGLNVYGKDHMGNTPDRWLHDVYLVILFLFIGDCFFRSNHLLQKAIEDKQSGLYGKIEKSIKERKYRNGDGHL
jgi:hypothetical protein